MKYVNGSKVIEAGYTVSHTIEENGEEFTVVTDGLKKEDADLLTVLCQLHTPENIADTEFHDSLYGCYELANKSCGSKLLCYDDKFHYGMFAAGMIDLGLFTDDGDDRPVPVLRWRVEFTPKDIVLSASLAGVVFDDVTEEFVKKPLVEAFCLDSKFGLDPKNAWKQAWSL